MVWRVAVGLGALLLSGCITTQMHLDRNAAQETTSCVFDKDLLLPWSSFGEVGSLRQAPYIASYSGCGKALHFVAAEHTNDPSSLTFELVERAISLGGDVGFVLIEGLPSAYGASNQQVLDFAQSADGTPADSEALFAVRKAASRDIPFQGAEPSDSAILIEADLVGISAPDLLGFYILRQIEQAVRSGQLSSHTDPRLQEVIEVLLGQLVRDTGLTKAEFAPVSKIEGFKNWYRVLNGADFESTFRFEDVYPSTTQYSRPSNLLSDKVSDIRDRTIIAMIEDALENNSIVVVVYGASHHDIQRPVFEAAFGPATISSR